MEEIMEIDQSTEAAKNLKRLFENPYPGRGIVIGRDESGNLVQIYWIMGRSANSRNRIFSAVGPRIFTEPADPAKAGDTSLIIYNAMDYIFGQHVVSNGKQTDQIIAEINGHDNFSRFAQGLSTHIYEPDKPNYTPRISAIITAEAGKKPGFHMSVLRKSNADESCERLFYSYEDIPAGFGRMVTTYTGDGNPLPSFIGEPILVPLQGDIEEIKTAYWFALNEENRVSLAVKLINPETCTSKVLIINKYKKTEV